MVSWRENRKEGTFLTHSQNQWKSPTTDALEQMFALCWFIFKQDAILTRTPEIQRRTVHVQYILYSRNTLLLYTPYRLDRRNSPCSLTFQFSLGFVATVSILCNPCTRSLTAGHSITPSLAVFAVTNRCVPAKLFLNKWMCFLHYTTTPDLFFFCWTKQTRLLFVTSEVYCISHSSGDRYFSGRRIDTSVGSSLLAALQITCLYLYIVCCVHLFKKINHILYKCVILLFYFPNITQIEKVSLHSKNTLL